jgi:hypothetical protein
MALPRARERAALRILSGSKSVSPSLVSERWDSAGSMALFPMPGVLATNGYRTSRRAIGVARPKSASSLSPLQAHLRGERWISPAGPADQSGGASVPASKNGARMWPRKGVRNRVKAGGRGKSRHGCSAAYLLGQYTISFFDVGQMEALWSRKEYSVASFAR